MTPLRLLSFSDCHLGNNRIPSETMCQSLSSLIFPLLDKTDLVVLGGDLFDAAISLADVSIKEILDWIMQFLSLCDQKNITVRVLRGTYSHDRIQPSIIPILHQRMGCQNDLRYFDKITLEYIERFDLKVLYIPDDVPYASSDDVLNVVQDQLQSLGWQNVDFAFLHSYFDHVLPEFASSKPKITYRQEQFNFVRFNVLVGHVHTSSALGKVLYNGSTDRICHGEEEAKGCLYLTCDGQSTKITFVENTQASIFKTIDLHTLTDEDEVIQRLVKIIESYPAQQRVHLRVEHPKADIRTAVKKYVNIHYPNVVLTHFSSDKKIKLNIPLDEQIADIQLLTPPTIETLPQNILDQLAHDKITHALSVESIAHLLQIARTTS